MKVYFFALGLLIILPLTGSAQEFQHLEYGVNKIGFKSTLVLDYSRPSRHPHQPGRALQINTWYPAGRKGIAPMNFAAYVSLKANEDSIVNPVKSKKSAIKKSVIRHPSFYLYFKILFN